MYIKVLTISSRSESELMGGVKQDNFQVSGCAWGWGLIRHAEKEDEKEEGSRFGGGAARKPFPATCV